MKIVKYLLVIIFGLVIYLYIPDNIFAQELRCGASVMTGLCVKDGAGGCMIDNRNTTFVNCNCSSTIQTLSYCSRSTIVKCVKYQKIRVIDYYEYKYVCDNKPIAVENKSQVFAQEIYTACSWKRVPVYKYVNGDCSEYDYSDYSCNNVYSNVACSTPPPSEPSCPAQSACTPSCPAGTVPYNTGGTVASSANCSYQTGGTTSSGTCATNTVTTQCWNQVSNPLVTVTNIESQSALGCISNSSYVGRDANNTNRVTVKYYGELGSDPYTSLQTWFSKEGSAPTPISTVLDSGTPSVLTNASYGFMVRKVSGTWSDIYVPSYQSGSHVWVKAGTVGTGLRAEILGKDQKKMIGIKNVTVTPVGTEIDLQFEIEHYTSDTGLADFESSDEGLFRLYTAQSRQSTFLPSGGSTVASTVNWTVSNRSWTVDLSNPFLDTLEYNITGSSRVDINWRFTDSVTNIQRVVGDADITNATNPDTIDNLTSGVSNYVFGSGSSGANLYGGTHLWSVNNLGNRTEDIDLNNNTKGRITTTVNAFDNACNRVEASTTLPLGIAWIVTKGGHVFGGSGVEIDIFNLTGHSGFSDDPYWGSPFTFYKDEADITSELVSATTTSINSLIYPQTVGSSRSINHFDTNNRKNYWYDELLRRTDLKIAQDSSKYDVVTYTQNSTISDASTSISNGGNQCSGASNKGCVVKVTGDLLISSNFVCDAKTVIFVSGSANIRPNVTSPNFDSGCIIVAKGDINVRAGEYQSSGSTYPKYDIVQAFLISDSTIQVPYVDSTQTVRDGLLVHGSMVAFGGTNSSSIVLGRSFELLQNNNFPALAIHFDNRYLSFAPYFFGGELEGFRREVGYKPL